MPVEGEYAYDEAFVSIEPVPKEYIESDEIINFEFIFQNT